MTKQKTRKRFVLGAGGGALVLLAALTATTAKAQDPALVASVAARKIVTPQVLPEPGGDPQPGQSAEPQIKEDLFAGTEKFAKGASDVTEVTMDPDTLNMVSGPNAKRAHKMVLSVVRTYSYDKPGMYNIADVEEFRRRLETGDWHCSVHIRDLKSGESTDVCNKRRAPDMIENAIITVEPKSLTFVHTIRKANGEGGSMDGLPGLGFLSGMPINLAMTMEHPEMAAK